VIAGVRDDEIPLARQRPNQPDVSGITTCKYKTFIIPEPAGESVLQGAMRAVLAEDESRCARAGGMFGGGSERVPSEAPGRAVAEVIVRAEVDGARVGRLIEWLRSNAQKPDALELREILGKVPEGALDGSRSVAHGAGGA
jgi:hypothetical protein